ALAGGGGAQDGRLYNCTLIGNSAEYGSGGTSGSTLYNCIVYYNTASDEPNYDSNSKFYYSCTTPLPRGEGNIDSAPLFVDLSNGNLRLQSNSPCINAGDNDYVSASIDLDGRPRIVDGTVDMGAYEFQSAVPGQFIGWLQNYGLPTDGSADNTDSDNDGFDNWQEFQLGLNPIISNIGGHFKGIQNLSNKRIRLNFIGKPGKRYQLETSSNLIDWVEFISISITNSDYSIGIDETNNAPIRFYRSRLISE
ncbi:MAG TPA: choice-of-anchor Q domain-containing protein, partial [Verrucomicrobiota bacterium]|nr:choice-of-anchor Q domain-containing protein [Verrucomicrobiota bacterium]